jgi:hypothetical protein
MKDFGDFIKYGFLYVSSQIPHCNTGTIKRVFLFITIYLAVSGLITKKGGFSVWRNDFILGLPLHWQ